MTVEFRAKISEHTNRVLGVIKERYGLKDKSQALDKFAQMHGDNYVPYELKEEVVRQLVKECSAHYKKHGKRTMSAKELEELFSDV